MIKEILRYQEVSSTQDTARRFFHNKKEIAISALCQKRGRGRHGRSWLSPRGGLYVSLLLFPEKRISSIPLLAALSVVKLLENYNFSKISILWPNDILLNSKKVCGIICEKYKDAVICGIGININNEEFGPELYRATSFRLESKRLFDIDEVLNNFIGTFNPLYQELQLQGLRIKEVLNYLGGMGEMVEVITPQRVFKGTVFNIDDDWALLLRDESGLIKKLHYGDVRRLQW